MPIEPPRITSPISTGGMYWSMSLIQMRLVGSSERYNVRTKICPGPGTGRGCSTNSRSPGLMSPTGRFFRIHCRLLFRTFVSSIAGANPIAAVTDARGALAVKAGQRYSRGMKWFAAFILLLAAASPAMAQVDDGAKVQARLIAESASVAPGGTVAIAFEQVIRPGWHTYWLNPGDVGQPTTLTWSLPAGWKAGALQWPYPMRLPVGPFMDYGYEGKVWILTHVTAPANATPGDTVTLRAAASWLVCKEICIPEDTTLTVPLKIGPAAIEPSRAGAFAAARARMPVPSPWTMRYALGVFARSLRCGQIA